MENKQKKMNLLDLMFNHKGACTEAQKHSPIQKGKKISGWAAFNINN
jgi:hypothetical protein